MGTQQTGARHPCSPFTQYRLPPGPLCRASGLSFPLTHGPHLRLCLGIPCFGLLQDFFKGHFHISPHGPFHTGEKHTECHEAGPCCLSGSGGDYNNGLGPRAACQNPGQTQTDMLARCLPVMQTAPEHGQQNCYRREQLRAAGRTRMREHRRQSHPHLRTQTCLSWALERS